jgi:hypothetical protein
MLSGDRITGAFNNLPATGDIYPLVLGNRFATLIFLRTEAVNPAGQSAWRGMLDTLSLAGSNKDAADLDFQFIPIESGVINGRAIKMPSPKRPNVRGILSGTQTVLIRVQTDLEGNVISARAESGNQLLWQAAIDAAKKAKFAPTMRCGVPLKIAGVIVYKFLPGLNGQF